MKNQEKITELKEFINASGIGETIQTLQELFGEYMRSKNLNTKGMQEKKKEVGLGILEVLETIWKLEKALKFVLEQSAKWEETEIEQNSEAPYW